MNSHGASGEQNEICNIPNDVLFKYIESSVNLEVAKEMAIQNMNILRQKRAELVEEKKKLNDLHQQVFSMNDDICESVWKFSNKYEFPCIIENSWNGRVKTRKTQPPRETVDVLKDSTRVSDRNSLVNVEQEPTIDVQSSTSKSETQEISEIRNNIPSSKFVLKTPTVIPRLYKKR